MAQKRSQAPGNIESLRKKKIAKTEPKSSLFKGLGFALLEGDKLTRKRREIFESIIQEHSGQLLRVSDVRSPALTHLVMEPDLLRWPALANVFNLRDIERRGPSLHVVTSAFISEAVKAKQLPDPSAFSVPLLEELRRRAGVGGQLVPSAASPPRTAPSHPSAPPATPAAMPSSPSPGPGLERYHALAAAARVAGLPLWRRQHNSTVTLAAAAVLGQHEGLPPLERLGAARRAEHQQQQQRYEPTVKTEGQQGEAETAAAAAAADVKVKREEKDETQPSVKIELGAGAPQQQQRRKIRVKNEWGSDVEEEEEEVKITGSSAAASVSLVKQEPGALVTAEHPSSVAAVPALQFEANLNERFTQPLERMAVLCGVRGGPNDHWKEKAYSEQIKQLGSFSGFSKDFVQKCIEILTSADGKFDKLRAVEREPGIQIREQFMAVDGVSAAIAKQWFEKGLRSFEDVLRAHAEGRVDLNRRQLLGLRYALERTQRIPREEVRAIVAAVREALSAVWRGAVAIPCGSYRRGARTSGDIDMIVTHPASKDDAQGSRERSARLQALVAKLTEAGVLTDHATAPDHAPGLHGSVSYSGYCVLPPGSPLRREPPLHRRIDIKFYPPEQLPFALLYLTGSAHLNRLMRYFALRKGWTLSDHGLSKAERVKGEVYAVGAPVQCRSEEEVFAAMGLVFIPPYQRDTKPLNFTESELAEVRAEYEAEKDMLRKAGLRPPDDAALIPSSSSSPAALVDLRALTKDTLHSIMEEDLPQQQQQGNPQQRPPWMRGSARSRGSPGKKARPAGPDYEISPKRADTDREEAAFLQAQAAAVAKQAPGP